MLHQVESTQVKLNGSSVQGDKILKVIVNNGDLSLGMEHSVQ